jgi:hypothetical protein
MAAPAAEIDKTGRRAIASRFFCAHFIGLRIAPPLSHRRHAPVIPPSEIAAKPRTTC